jgi:hypothetical protein
MISDADNIKNLQSTSAATAEPLQKIGGELKILKNNLKDTYKKIKGCKNTSDQEKLNQNL